MTEATIQGVPTGARFCVRDLAGRVLEFRKVNQSISGGFARYVPSESGGVFDIRSPGEGVHVTRTPGLWHVDNEAVIYYDPLTTELELCFQ